MKKLYVMLAFALMAKVGLSQDPHFSQFYAAPLTINPASAGVIDGDYRFVGNYRNQWSSFTNPYQTFAASFDMKVPSKDQRDHFFGIGISFMNDQAGDSHFTTTEGNFTISYVKRFTDQFLSIGAMGGFGQTSLNYKNLYWDSQIVGDQFVTSNPSGENTTNSSTGYGDFSFGALYGFKPNKDFNMQVGGSVFHINSPKEEFTNGIISDQLFPKITLHSQATVVIGDQTSLVPALLFLKQGPSTEVTAGSLIKYSLWGSSQSTGFEHETNVYFGAFFRFGDALIIATKFEYLGLAIGISYDVNVSDLNRATADKGGPEFSLIYTGQFNKSHYGGSKNVKLL